MEKQQKILEMAKDICRVKLNCNDVCNPISACDALKYAERAVEAGYIKVVRCKECKHRYVPTRCALWSGTLGDKEYFRYHGDDFYCSYGEREGGDEK